MENDQFFHSVYLDRDKCLGCTTCLRNCPTGAIRVREGKAKIIQTKCIDCGECIRVCPHNAKSARTDDLKIIRNYSYKVAIVAPTLIGQFELRYSIERILAAVKSLGFDEVVEVAYGAEIVGRSLAKEFDRKDQLLPIISSACPAVSKLIQIRFPELTGNIVNLKSPMGVTARLVRQRLEKEKGLKMDDIGVFFITPCAAKATEVKNPENWDDAYDVINGAISIKDIYGMLRSNMRKVEEEDIHTSSAKGFGWALSGGESRFVQNKRLIHVDGISNVIRILDEIENGNLEDIAFFEGLACIGGCVGGCLAVQNGFVARMIIEERAKKDAHQNLDGLIEEAELQKLIKTGNLHRKRPLQPRVFKPLDEDFQKSLDKMQQIEILESRLPGLDCGSCGAPGCRALAEDIVTGYAREIDCVFVLKDRVLELSKLTSEMLQMGHPMDSQHDAGKKKE